MSELPTVTCPACGLAQEAPEGDVDYLAKNICRCSECNSIIAFGEVVPRVVVEFDDRVAQDGQRALRIRLQNPVTKADEKVFLLDSNIALGLKEAIGSVMR